MDDDIKDVSAIRPRAKKRKRLWLLVIPPMLFVLIVAYAVFTPDPGEGVADFQLTNDLGKAVEIKGGNGSEGSRPHVKPGQSITLTGVVQGVNQGFYVTDLGGHVIGCIPLNFEKRPRENRLTISSQMQKC